MAVFSSVQRSSTVHTVWRQLDDELEGSDMLELRLKELEESILRPEEVEEDGELKDGSNSDDNVEDEDEADEDEEECSEDDIEEGDVVLDAEL